MLRSFLFIIGNEVAIEVGIELLNSEKEDITDEDITENIKERIEKVGIDFEPDDAEILKLNTVRKTLYKLYSAKLAQFRRIRDKSTGWFVYFWTLHPERIDVFVEKKQQEVLETLQSRLNYEESNMFFTCNNPECPRVIFQEAMDQNFECGRCGGRLEAFDNEQLINVLKEKIVELEEIKDKTQKIMKGEK